ncbi:glycosyltransferase family 2 protein [Bryobacter aggregatus]|uniref:glycosyltransferase family 2 protein n=1 Tax=Bryobacter aggregatus TaxID=360054 RepID=UPI001EE1E39A|nr:glycosyltransferase family 2 protein [Bryobacter aggregatus]
MKISAAIITFNEERNIGRAIESLRCCDEILVIDSGSSDRTVELAKIHGATVIETFWRGYAAQKNFAAESCQHDWVLSIDADEALSESLEGEIWQLKKNGPSFDGYTMPRLAQYLGRWILHSGWYPDRKVRLFHRSKAKWVGEYVHESVVVEGRVGHLETNLLHYTCSSLSEHLKSMDRYTTLAAEQIVATRKPIRWRNMAIDPAWTFFKSYFIQRGFLDGAEGLAIAYMAGIYTFLKYAKARNFSPQR